MDEKGCFQVRWASFFVQGPLEAPCWASFFAPTGTAPGLVSGVRPPCWQWWGFCTTRGSRTACRRRVGPSCSAIPPPGAGGVATRGGVVPKVQTVLEKDADNGLLWAKRSAILATGSETVPGPAGRSRLLEGSSAS